jgi:hypothetical protein
MLSRSDFLLSNPFKPTAKWPDSNKSFVLLASPKPQSLNTWAEMLPRAEALCEEVARINAALKVPATTTGTIA